VIQREDTVVVQNCVRVQPSVKKEFDGHGRQFNFGTYWSFHVRVRDRFRGCIALDSWVLVPRVDGVLSLQNGGLGRPWRTVQWGLTALAVSQHVPLARAGSGEPLGASCHGAGEGLLPGVGPHVLLQSRLLVPPLSASLKRTHEGLLSSVNSGMDQEMRRPQEGLPASRESAGMWLGTLVVSSTVVYEVSFAGEFSSANVALESLTLTINVV